MEARSLIAQESGLVQPIFKFFNHSVTGFILKYYFRILLACAALSLTACATSPSQLSANNNIGWIKTGKKHILPTPEQCYFPIDERKYVYPINIKALAPEEKVKFISIGWRGSNVIYTAAQLLQDEVQLPPMLITSRRDRHNRGLWIERIATGERVQLSYLPDTVACNRKGIAIVKYTNLWIAASSE